MLRLDFLPEYRLTSEAFAASLRLPPDAVEALLDEARSVDADIALRLARFFGTSPEMWMALQRDVDFFDSLEASGAEIDAIVPIDHGTSVSAQEDDPLPEEVLLGLREQLADLDDRTRWMIVSVLGDDDPADEDMLYRTYYEVASDCWAVGIEHGTAFKREWAAQAVADGLGARVHVVAVLPGRLERPARVEAADMATRKRHLRRSREGLRPWHPSEFLQTDEDMAAYLEIAVEDAQPALLSAAVKDVLSAMRRRYCEE